jgi:hypothetical protein
VVGKKREDYEPPTTNKVRHGRQRTQRGLNVKFGHTPGINFKSGNNDQVDN